MKLIVCIDKKFGIGYDGKLLYSIPEDMKFFREKTKDAIVVMGLNTLYSFKNKSPLKGRINVVFAPNVSDMQDEYKDFDNIIFINDENKIKEISDKYPDRDVYVIGGASIYKLLYKNCDTIYITKMYKEFKADTYFPDVEKDGYKVIEKSEIYTHETEDGEKIDYQFLTYQKGE